MVDYNWVLQMFPSYIKHKLLIKFWLKTNISQKRFSQGSLIGSLFENFILNGLKDVIQPEKVKYQNGIEWKWFLKKGLEYEIVNKECCVVIKNWVVRYADDFVIITNFKNEIFRIMTKIWEFFASRGLKLSDLKSKIFKIDTERAFDFLGFTFKFIKQPKITWLTKKVNNKSQIIRPRTGLFIYVSNDSIRKFKTKINMELKFKNKSVFQIIMRLNFIIKSWLNYFGIGSYKIFEKLDWYIFRKCFKFIFKKFKGINRYNIISNFFLHNVNWNLNVPISKIKKSVHVIYAILVKICSIIKFISILRFRPINLELKNPFIFNKIKGLWLKRIIKLRYKFGNLNFMLYYLINKKKSVSFIQNF